MIMSVVYDVGPCLYWVYVVLLHLPDYLLGGLYLIFSYDSSSGLVFVTCRIEPFALPNLLYFEPGLGVDVEKIPQYFL